MAAIPAAVRMCLPMLFFDRVLRPSTLWVMAALSPCAAALAQPLISDVRVFQGTVVLPADQSEVVSMPLPGVVQRVLVTPMSAVRAGQPVVRVISPALVEMQREWVTAHTQARLAQATAARDEALFNEGLVAQQRQQASRAQFEMADLAARERREALRLAGVSDEALQPLLSSPVPGASSGQATAAASPALPSGLQAALELKAPTSGTVLEVLALPGQRLEAGAPVVRLGRMDKLVIELQATQAQLAGLRVGDTLRVDGCQRPARLSAIGRELNSATQNVMMRAELSGRDDCLRINQFVTLRWQRAAGR